MDEETSKVLRELSEAAKKERERSRARETMEWAEEAAHSKPASEEEARDAVLKRLLQQPQNLFLNDKQTKQFLRAGSILEIRSVPLRQRILQPGEIIMILTHTKEYAAEVVRAERSDRNSKMGFTNLTIRKL